jgi:alpha-ketoglutarate-dependent taurine dioxygenase
MSTAAAAILERADHNEIAIRPLQPTIGAEIGGVDLRQPLSPAVRDAIKAAILQYKVVFFRDQTLTDEQHAAFARQFGPLYTHPSTSRDSTIAQIHRISAEDAARYEKKRARDVRPGDAYHTDTSWRLVPTWGAVLRAVGHDYPVVAHPLVRTHRETGQKILWANFTQKPQILGVELAESQALLDEILRQYKRPEFQVRFSWKPGSIAFWDNRAAVHYAVRNYGDFPRLLERVLIADEPLYADL